MKKLKDWFPALLIPGGIIFTLLCVESRVISRQEIMVDGKVLWLQVMKGRELGVSSVWSTGVTLSEKDGSIIATRGIWGGRGRFPIIYHLPATPDEVALYHRFF